MSDDAKDEYADLVLSDAERNSSLWKRMEKHLSARLDRLRAQNDHEMSPERTAMLRGRIGELKLMLAAGASQD